MDGRELAMLVRAAYLTLHRRANAIFSPLGATADQFVLLSLLAEEDGVTQQRLVERSCSDPNTIRAMLVLMEGRGWIRREPHPEDGRARRVTLTPHGKRLQRQLAEAGEPFHRGLLAVVSTAERRALADVLRRIADSMAAANGPRT